MLEKESDTKRNKVPLAIKVEKEKNIESSNVLKKYSHYIVAVTSFILGAYMCSDTSTKVIFVSPVSPVVDNYEAPTPVPVPDILTEQQVKSEQEIKSWSHLIMNNIFNTNNDYSTTMYTRQMFTEPAYQKYINDIGIEYNNKLKEQWKITSTVSVPEILEVGENVNGVRTYKLRMNVTESWTTPDNKLKTPQYREISLTVIEDSKHLPRLQISDIKTEHILKPI